MLVDGSTRRALQRLSRLAADASAHAWADEENSVALRQAAAKARQVALENLPAYLEQLETSASGNGVQVHWADGAQEANRLIIEIQQASAAPEAVRNHSQLLEEISLDRAAKANNIRLIRLHPGDQILELAGSRSSHPVWPTAHLRIDEISTATQRRWRVPITYDPDILASTIRMPLRRSLLRSYTAIIGLHFAVADTGDLVCLDNDGHNASLVSFSRHLICLLSLEQVVATTSDLHHLVRAYAHSAWGRPLPAYVTQVRQPTPPGIDGPREIHLIIMDNKRSHMFAEGYGEILRCIGCGACLNVCPIYPLIGGEGYGESPYSGPRGAALNPLLLRPDLANQQPYLSTACSACKPVCPVDIDLPRLLHEQRHRLAPSHASWQERTLFWIWRRLLKRPTLFRLGMRVANRLNRITHRGQGTKSD
ncbi:MAG: lactate utilization protein [Chloroflexi bacterium]|nr:lactate utilization protein [Chloroflexota bacterium]